MLRLDPRYHQGRRLLLAGRIGRPLHLTTRRSSAIGAAARYGASTSLVWHVAIHDIDLVRWFMQREIIEVYAHGVSRRLRDVGHYDALLALLRFADGTPCAMECSWVLPEHLGTALDARLDVLGEAGRIEIQGFEQGLRVTDATSIGFPDTTRWGEYEDGTPYGILMAEIAHFIGCVREGCPPAVTAQDALRTVQVAAAMERSIREGVPVHVNNSGIRGNG
jgi:myo-inositol 2-dehydrogenase/D-chiro-inositol 1-dehydrogenase